MPLPEPLRRELEPRYEVVRLLAGGGMAEVYLARDLRHEREVVVKVLRPESASAVAVERFRREVALLARLQHPHIVPLIASGEVAGIQWLVAPYIAGGTLADRLLGHDRLGVTETVAIARQVVAALEAAHRHGIVHRDVKPSNILLGNGGALLADFGISALAHTEAERLTATGVSVGTPAYMSPEQASGSARVGPAADIYSLGCVLFECLGGQPPFPGPDARAIMARHVLDPVPSLAALRPGLSPALDAVVQRCLAKDAADRWPSAAVLGEALNGPFDPTPGEGTRSSTRPRLRTRRLTLAAGASFTLVSIGWLLAARPPARPVVTERQLTFRGDVREGAISPNGEFVAYLTRDTLWVLDLATGEALGRPLANQRVRLGGWAHGGTALVLNDPVNHRVISIPRFGGREQLLAQGSPQSRVMSDGAWLLREVLRSGGQHVGMVVLSRLADSLAPADTVILAEAPLDSTYRVDAWAVSPRRELAMRLATSEGWLPAVVDLSDGRVRTIDLPERFYFSSIAWARESEALYIGWLDSIVEVKWRGRAHRFGSARLAATGAWSITDDRKRVLVRRGRGLGELVERPIVADSAAVLGRQLSLSSGRTNGGFMLAPDGQRLAYLAAATGRSETMPWVPLTQPMLYSLSTTSNEKLPLDSARYAEALAWSATGISLLAWVQLGRDSVRGIHLHLPSGVITALGTTSVLSRTAELSDGRLVWAHPTMPREGGHLRWGLSERPGTAIADLGLPESPAIQSDLFPAPDAPVLSYLLQDSNRVTTIDISSGKLTMSPGLPPSVTLLDIQGWDHDGGVWVLAVDTAASAVRHQVWRWDTRRNRFERIVRRIPDCGGRYLSITRRSVLCTGRTAWDVWLLESDRPVLR